MKTPLKSHNRPTGEAVWAKVCMYIWQSCVNWIIWKANGEKRLLLTNKRDTAEWRTLTCTQKKLAVQNVKSWRVNAPLLLLLVSLVSSAGELCQYQHQILIRIKTEADILLKGFVWTPWVKCFTSIFLCNRCLVALNLSNFQDWCWLNSYEDYWLPL